MVLMVLLAGLRRSVYCMVGLGLIAVLVTAVGEFVEGLKQEAILQAQRRLEQAAKMASEVGHKAVDAGQTHNVQQGAAKQGHKSKLSLMTKRNSPKKGESQP